MISNYIITMAREPTKKVTSPSFFLGTEIIYDADCAERAGFGLPKDTAQGIRTAEHFHHLGGKTLGAAQAGHVTRAETVIDEQYLQTHAFETEETLSLLRTVDAAQGNTERFEPDIRHSTSRVGFRIDIPSCGNLVRCRSRGATHARLTHVSRVTSSTLFKRSSSGSTQAIFMTPALSPPARRRILTSVGNSDSSCHQLHVISHAPCTWDRKRRKHRLGAGTSFVKMITLHPITGESDHDSLVGSTLIPSSQQRLCSVRCNLGSSPPSRSATLMIIDVFSTAAAAAATALPTAGLPTRTRCTDLIATAVLN